MNRKWKSVDDQGSYVITYYGAGMGPKYLRFTDEDEALAEFKEMCEDPRYGASSLEFRRMIAERVYA